MVRITQLQPAQALEAAKNLDAIEERQEIRSLAHDMNIAASPDVAVEAMKDKIVEILEYHNAKEDRKERISKGETDVPDLPPKPNLRLTTGNPVPDKLESEVDVVASEDPHSGADAAKTKKKSGSKNKTSEDE